MYFALWRLLSGQFLETVDSQQQNWTNRCADDAEAADFHGQSLV
jgi:hypothetical protein